MSLRLAALGPPGAVELRNFSTSGALTADVATAQVPAARRWRPQVATLLVGVNDTLRDTFDIGRATARLWEAVHGLHDAGAVVVTACLPEPGRMLRMPAALGRPLARRGLAHQLDQRIAEDVRAAIAGLPHYS